MSAPSIRSATSTGDPDRVRVAVAARLQPARRAEVIGQRFAPMARPGDRWGVWGSGDVSQFGGDFDGFRQDGTVLSGYLGADYRFAPYALAGLAASYSSLDLTSTSEVEGKATLTGSLDGGDAGYRFGFGGSLEY